MNTEDRHNLAELYDKAKKFICIDDEGRHTIEEVKNKASELIELIRVNAKKNDRVMLLGDNSSSTISAIYAVAKSDCILIPMGKSVPFVELERRVRILGVKIVIAVGKHESEKLILSNTFERINSAGNNEYVVYRTNNNDDLPIQYSSRFADACLILFTSGTNSNQSSAVVLSSTGLFKMFDMVRNYMHVAQWDRMFVTKQYYHISTFVTEILLCIYVDATLSLHNSSLLLPRLCLRNAKEDCATIIFTNPHILSQLSKKYIKRQIESLRLVYCSGSILSSTLHKTACEVFYPAKVFNVYGLTEAGPRVFAQDASDDVVYGSVGKPLMGISVSLQKWDEELEAYGDVSSPYEVGELFVKSPCMMLGYWGESDALEMGKMRKGVLRTGDVAMFDSNGNYYILSRCDDVIVKQSRLVIPAMVEEAINSYPEIEKCVVFGREKNDGDEKIIAIYISKANVEIKKTQLNEYLLSKLEPFQLPDEICRVTSLPYSDQGKILRKMIKHDYINGQYR